MMNPYVFLRVNPYVFLRFFMFLRGNKRAKKSKKVQKKSRFGQREQIPIWHMGTWDYNGTRTRVT
jgi:hypothetical protein